MSGRYMGRHKCNGDSAISPAALNATAKRRWTRDEERQPEPDESEELVASFPPGTVETAHDDGESVHLRAAGGRHIASFRGRHRVRLSAEGGVNVYRVPEAAPGEEPAQDDEMSARFKKLTMVDSHPAKLAACNDSARRFWRGRPATRATTDNAAEMLSSVTVASGPSNAQREQQQIKAHNARARRLYV